MSATDAGDILIPTQTQAWFSWCLLPLPSACPALPSAHLCPLHVHTALCMPTTALCMPTAAISMPTAAICMPFLQRTSSGYCSWTCRKGQVALLAEVVAVPVLKGKLESAILGNIIKHWPTVSPSVSERLLSCVTLRRRCHPHASDSGKCLPEEAKPWHSPGCCRGPWDAAIHRDAPAQAQRTH